MLIDGKEWRLVPVPATQEMQDAGRAALASGAVPMAKLFHAMIDAAPSPPAVHEAVPKAWLPIIDGIEKRPTTSKFDADELVRMGAVVVPLFTHAAAVPAAQPVSDVERARRAQRRADEIEALVGAGKMSGTVLGAARPGDVGLVERQLGTGEYILEAGKPSDDGRMRTAVARAIWNVRREYEDRCDMELEDMATDHPVWMEADAAIRAAIAIGKGAPS